MDDIIRVPAAIRLGYMTKALGGASMTKIIPQRNCEYCNMLYQPLRETARFCSRACSHNSWVERHKEQWTAYMRSWLSNNSDYHHEYSKSEKGKEVQKRRHEKHPLQRKARTAISNALRLGKITKPNYCEISGCKETRLEAHHWKGYDPKHWLNVKWLCHNHHLEAEYGR